MTLRHRVENGLGLWQLKLPPAPARLDSRLRPGRRPYPPSSSSCFRPSRATGSRPVARLRTRRSACSCRTMGGRGPRSRSTGSQCSTGSGCCGRSTSSRPSWSAGARSSWRGSRRRCRRGRGRRRRDAEAHAGARAAPPAGGRRPGHHGLGAARMMSAACARRAASRTTRHRRGRDPEDLHQFRVATRRSRAFLRSARPVLLPEWARGAARGAALARRRPRPRAQSRRLPRAPARGRRHARRARPEGPPGAVRPPGARA